MNRCGLLVLVSFAGALSSACAPVRPPLPYLPYAHASLVCSAAELNRARLEEEGRLPHALQFSDAEPLRGRYLSGTSAACGSRVSADSPR